MTSIRAIAASTLTVGIVAASAFGASAASAAPYPAGTPTCTDPTAYTAGQTYTGTCTGLVANGTIVVSTDTTTGGTSTAQNVKSYPVDAQGNATFAIATSTNNYLSKVIVTQAAANNFSQELDTIVGITTVTYSNGVFTITGLIANGAYQLLNPDGSVLANFTGRADGTASVTATPKTASVVSLRPTGGAVLATVTVTVASTGGSLAFTGSDVVLPGLGLGVVLVAAGGAFVVAGRRRVSA